MHLKIILLSLNCLILACCASAFQPPRDAIVLWERSHTSVLEKKEIMLKCGYPNTAGEGDMSDRNKIALMHICMEENGFKYIGKYGTFCKSYPNLPACVAAAEEKRKKK